MSSRFRRTAVAVLLLAGGCEESTVNNGGVVIPTTVRVSVGVLGQQANGEYRNPVLTPDGRWLAFESNASNLIVGDTNGKSDIFVRDMLTGVVERVSLRPGGTEAIGDCRNPAITPDGRYVVFDTWDGAISQNGNIYQVFRHDRQSGQTVLVSLDGGGSSGDEDSEQPAISADGRYVAFQSAAFNITGVSGTTFIERRICRRDLQSGSTIVLPTGTTPNASSRDCTEASISDDGNFIAFTQTSRDDVDFSTETNVWRRDIAGAILACVSVTVFAQRGRAASTEPMISPDGRYVVFTSLESDLAVDDRSGASIFLRDMQAGVTTVVSRSATGETSIGDCRTPWITPDARYVAFSSVAGNLVAGDTNLAFDVYVHDRVLGRTTRASLRTHGSQTAFGTVSERPVLPADARFVVFESTSPTLEDGDTNGVVDLFKREPIW